eukprot:TRINITY_DN380_c0_g1_i1.p1 TRINITY_DN380_c0_g1~~TRINITY_DN380_c0_g1_i1.p1  ORF type:complete len:365 (+),score=82.17 TRINITY_DN380_c0_g1_i1:774-1868(+)
MEHSRLDQMMLENEAIEWMDTYNIPGLSIHCFHPTSFDSNFTISLGTEKRGKPVTSRSRFQIASLSKTVGTAFALMIFEELKISVDSKIMDLGLDLTQYLTMVGSDRVCEWVTLKNLMNHTAFNMHYVYGFAEEIPDSVKLLDGSVYEEKVGVIAESDNFSYSGGGFLLLEYIVKLLLGDEYGAKLEKFLKDCGMEGFSFGLKRLIDPEYDFESVAIGANDDGQPLPHYLQFPAYAAGGIGTSEEMGRFLSHIGNALKDPSVDYPISNRVAVAMTSPNLTVEKDTMNFMGVNVGLGGFIAGKNKCYVHHGSNDGFRAVFSLCLTGEHAGSGFVILARGKWVYIIIIISLNYQLQTYLKLGNFKG